MYVFNLVYFFFKLNNVIKKFRVPFPFKLFLIIRNHAFRNQEKKSGKKLSLYFQYLPVMNLVLSCVGIYLIILASRFWRSRNRNK